LEGLFGPVKQFVNTKQLIDAGNLAKLKIKCLILKYPKEDCQLVRSMKYQDEVDWIVRNDKRNNFIKNLALSQKGNTLLLYQFVDKHGRVLYDLVRKGAQDGRKIFFVSGGTSAEDRETIRGITERENSAIIVASLGTFSTGINIRNLHNIIFSSPSKSRIRNLQSIGRGLRQSSTKNEAILIDISDDLRYNNSINYALKHFAERVKLYNSESFNYKLYNIKL
jgi:superfamily II DNA or RNA helicase